MTERKREIKTENDREKGEIVEKRERGNRGNERMRETERKREREIRERKKRIRKKEKE